MPLTDTSIRNAKPATKAQKLSDGEGLYLHISPTGGKLWRMAYRFGGKQKTLSFGPYPAVSLQEARRRRTEAKGQLAAGLDPGEQKKEAKKAAAVAKKEAENTFEAIAREWYASYSPSLTQKHALKLMRYLEKDYFPAIGGMLMRACPGRNPGEHAWTACGPGRETRFVRTLTTKKGGSEEPPDVLR